MKKFRKPHLMLVFYDIHPLTTWRLLEIVGYKNLSYHLK